MASSVPTNMDASNIASSVSHLAQASSSTPSAQPPLPIASPVPTGEASAPAQSTATSASTSRILDQVKHKNLLQEYAQKSNIPFPIYQTLNEGLPHAPKFRSVVFIEGKQYINPNCFPSRKAAEQAVAKLAMESISRNIQTEVLPLVHEETVTQKQMFCKNILHEFAVKMQLNKVKYETAKRGDLPVFVSAVVFRGQLYTGEAKSKKEAEQLAARAAILANLDSSPSGICLTEIIKSKFKHCSATAIESVKDSQYSNTVSPVPNAGHASVGAALVAAADNEMQVAHPQCSSIVPPPRQELQMPKQEISIEESKLSEDVSLQAGALQQQIDDCLSSKKRKRNKRKANKKSRHNNLPPVGTFSLNEVPPPSVALSSANDNEMLVAHPQCSSFVPPPRQELWMPKQEISTKGSELLEDVSLQAGAQQQQIDACSFSKNRKRKRKQVIKKSRLNNLPPVGKFPPNEVPPPVAALPMSEN